MIKTTYIWPFSVTFILCFASLQFGFSLIYRNPYAFSLCLGPLTIHLDFFPEGRPEVQEFEITPVEKKKDKL